MLSHAEQVHPFSSGRYKVLTNSLISRGVNCEVYEGINVVTGVHVCIKKIHLVNQIQRELTLNEISCLRMIEHPNVLRYLHHFQAGNFIYIVTELCEENLFLRLFKYGKLMHRQAMEVFWQLLDGYEEIRRKGFLHRDLKSENILIKRKQFKIGDLGFCIQTKEMEIKENYNIGSPLYMAPQVIEQNIYSEKSDIWSLGLLFYEMLHGKHPFKSHSEKELIQQIKQSTIKFECHPDVQALLKNALNYSKEKRFSLTQMRESLKEIMAYVPSVQNRLQSDQSEGESEEIIQNEFRYIRFMEYIKILCSKCKKNDRSSRISFLFQYSIRMRLHLIQGLSKASLIQPFLADQLAELKSAHSQTLPPTKYLYQNDRLRFFDANEPIFDYFVLWQIQAELKDSIKVLLRSLNSVNSEESVAKFENQLRLIDFLLTAYVLNRILIEQENNLDQFSILSQLSLILHRPQRFNLQVCRQIKQKASELRII